MVTLHRNAVRVQEALRAAGSDAQVVTLPDSTRSVAEAARTVGTTEERIAKSIVFASGDSGVVVVASGTNRVAPDKVAAVIGAPVTRADADRVRALTGFPIGGVPPLAHARRLPVVVDRDLLELDRVWAAAGTPNAVFAMEPDELVRVSGGIVADVRAD